MDRTKHTLPLLAITALLTAPVVAQVQTQVPPVIPNAKPVQVEHIKVHSPSLEGNLEKDAPVAFVSSCGLIPGVASMPSACSFTCRASGAYRRKVTWPFEPTSGDRSVSLGLACGGEAAGGC
jgi:hypothetical protein